MSGIFGKLEEQIKARLAETYDDWKSREEPMPDKEEDPDPEPKSAKAVLMPGNAKKKTSVSSTPDEVDSTVIHAAHGAPPGAGKMQAAGKETKAGGKSPSGKGWATKVSEDVTLEGLMSKISSFLVKPKSDTSPEANDSLKSVHVPTSGSSTAKASGTSAYPAKTAKWHTGSAKKGRGY